MSVSLLNRRSFLTAASAVALVQMRGFPAIAQSLDLEMFLDLSRRVTGFSALDARIAAPLLAAFTDAGVIADIASLSPAEDSAARRAVLRAWYLGKVSPLGVPAAKASEDLERGRGEEANDDDPPDLVLAYEGTLMGVVVADLMPLRSYCGGVPHFWAQPPQDPDVTTGGRP